MGARANARILSAALLVGMLGVGFLAGMAWQGDRVPEPAEDARERERGDRSGRSGRGLLIDQVGLSAETRAQAGDVIRHFRVQMHALDKELQAEYEPRQRALARRARDSIRSLLSPQERAVYDSLLAARHSRRGDGERSGNQER